MVCWKTCKIGGQSWVSLHVQLESFTLPPQQHQRANGPARQRRRERRATARANSAREAETTEEVVADYEESLVPVTAEEAIPVCTTEQVRVADVEKATKQLNNQMNDLGMENTKLKNNIQQLQKECESLRNTIAVNNMLHEDFKERVRINYYYDSKDEESDYESDEDARDQSRENFMIEQQNRA